MPRQLRIKLNLSTLISHISREEGHAVSTDDVYHWLSEAGFQRAGSYWLVSEADLGHLDPSEVLEVEATEDRR